MKAWFLRGMASVALMPMAMAHAGGDRVVNGAFVTDLSGWSANAPSGVSFDAADGAPLAGSAHLVAPAATTVFLSQCVAFTPAGPIDFFGSSLALAASGAPSAVLRYTEYDNATCNGSVLGAFNAAVVGTESGSGGTTWTRWGLQNAPLSASTRSVLIGIYAIASQPGDALDILWDHIQFGPSGTLPVELESFTIE
ncbi:MAG TPA: hypothetical protein VKB52_13240 [Rhodanobacteraceae bacterium]|nr:hypothetical protein [Rhodanobacteraceae bacterium]